jgi:hypothetical protein
MVGAFAGAVYAFGKSSQGLPEWSFWEQLAGQSWGAVAGADRPIFGYMPGFAALVRPFFAVPSPIGALLFVAMNVASCFGILTLLRVEFREGGKLVQLPLVVMTSCVFYLATQNNQVVAPSVFLTLLGYRLLMRTSWWGSAVIGFAVLIKTLPATLFLLFTLLRRFRLAFLGGVILVVASVGLSTMVEGFDVSFDAHKAFPLQVRSQDPNRVLTEGVTPRSFAGNISLAASVVRLAPWIGGTTALVVNRVIFWSTLLLVSLFAFRAGRCRSVPISILALWISWTILAAPFGRYYYAVFLLPAWWLCWPEGRTDSHPWWFRISLWLVALLPLATRSSNAIPYVLLTSGTFVACAYRCRRDIQASIAPPPA